MSDSVGWTDLVDLWRELPDAPTTPAELRATVDLQTRRLRGVIWIEAGIVVVMAAWLARALPLLPPEERPWWLLASALHVVVVVIFTAWNRRGLFSPLGESTRDYLRLARLRLERSLRTASFVVGVVVVEALALLLVAAGLGQRRAATAVGLAVVGVALTLVGAVWYRARTRRELARLAVVAQRYGLEPEAVGE
ncbi:MAG: hypothetical protein AB7R55_01950 [Gemmatimonadales bacterium]